MFSLPALELPLPRQQRMLIGSVCFAIIVMCAFVNVVGLWTGKVSQDASIQLQSLCSQLEYSDQQRTLAVVLMQSNSTSAASTYASAVQTVTSTLKAVNAMTRGAATALVQTNSVLMSIEAASTNSSYLSSGLSSAAYFDAKLSFARGVDALQAVAAEKSDLSSSLFIVGLSMTIVMCVFSIPTFALSMLEEDHSSEKRIVMQHAEPNPQDLARIRQSEAEEKYDIPAHVPVDIEVIEPAINASSSNPNVRVESLVIDVNPLFQPIIPDASKDNKPVVQIEAVEVPPVVAAVPLERPSSLPPPIEESSALPAKPEARAQSPPSAAVNALFRSSQRLTSALSQVSKLLVQAWECAKTLQSPMHTSLQGSDDSLENWSAAQLLTATLSSHLLELERQWREFLTDADSNQDAVAICGINFPVLQRSIDGSLESLHGVLTSATLDLGSTSRASEILARSPASSVREITPDDASEAVLNAIPEHAPKSDTSAKESVIESKMPQSSSDEITPDESVEVPRRKPALQPLQTSLGGGHLRRTLPPLKVYAQAASMSPSESNRVPEAAKVEVPSSAAASQPPSAVSPNRSPLFARPPPPVAAPVVKLGLRGRPKVLTKLAIPPPAAPSVPVVAIAPMSVGSDSPSPPIVAPVSSLPALPPLRIFQPSAEQVDPMDLRRFVTPDAPMLAREYVIESGGSSASEKSPDLTSLLVPVSDPAYSPAVQSAALSDVSDIGPSVSARFPPPNKVKLVKSPNWQSPAVLKRSLLPDAFAFSSNPRSSDANVQFWNHPQSSPTNQQSQSSSSSAFAGALDMSRSTGSPVHQFRIPRPIVPFPSNQSMFESKMEPVSASVAAPVPVPVSAPVAASVAAPVRELPVEVSSQPVAVDQSASSVPSIDLGRQSPAEAAAELRKQVSSSLALILKPAVALSSNTLVSRPPVLKRYLSAIAELDENENELPASVAASRPIQPIISTRNAAFATGIGFGFNAPKEMTASDHALALAELRAMSTIETHAQNMWSDHHHSELPMFKLSLDNVLHILGFLSTSDVMLHVSFVNRLFRLATLHGRCWSTFSLSSNKSLNDAAISRGLLMPRCRGVRALDLSHSLITDRLLSVLPRLCPLLECIDLSFCTSLTDEGILTLTKGMSRLREIRLRGPVDCKTYQLSDMSLEHIATHLGPTLCKLDVSGSTCFSDGGLLYLSGCGHLNSINIGSCPLISDSGLRNWLNSTELPYLRELNLSAFSRLSLASLTLISFTRIRVLDLSHAIMVLPAAVRVNVARSSSLPSHELDLVHDQELQRERDAANSELQLMHDLSSPGEAQPVSLDLRFEALEVLLMASDSVLIDTWLLLICQHASRLTSLSLVDCRRLSDHGLAPPLQHCPLVQLTLSNCPRVTPRAFSVLTHRLHLSIDDCEHLPAEAIANNNVSFK